MDDPGLHVRAEGETAAVSQCSQQEVTLDLHISLILILTYPPSISQFKCRSSQEKALRNKPSMCHIHLFI